MHDLGLLRPKVTSQLKSIYPHTLRIYVYRAYCKRAMCKYLRYFGRLIPSLCEFMPAGFLVDNRQRYARSPGSRKASEIYPPLVTLSPSVRLSPCLTLSLPLIAFPAAFNVLLVTSFLPYYFYVYISTIFNDIFRK